MKLQQLTGLTDKDPIHCYLKMVDEFMGNHDWSYVCKLPSKQVLDTTMLILKSFDFDPQVYQFDKLERYYEHYKETVLLEIVQKLRLKKIDLAGVRVVLYWILVNTDLIEERYFDEKHNRQLNDDWQPAW